MNGIVFAVNSNTVVVPTELLLEELIQRQLLSRGTPVKPEEAQRWSLRTGHHVVLEGDVVRAVFDITSPEEVKSAPDYGSHIRQNLLTYPPSEFDITLTNEYDLRVARALAPIGPGGQIFIKGPFGSGKTWLGRMLIEALLTIAVEHPEMVFVVLQIGERITDIAKMKAILDRFSDRVPIYHYFGFRGDTGPIANFNLSEMALAAVERLFELGRHVVYFVDSLNGLALDAYGPHAPKGTGLAGSGVPTYGLDMAKKHAAHAGWAPDGSRSMTAILTALSGESGSTRGGSIYDDAGGPQSSTTWALGRYPSADFPRFDLAGTGTREIVDMLGVNPERLAFHREIPTRMLATGRSGAKALEYVQALFRNRPFDPEAVKELWEKEDEEERLSKMHQAFQALVNTAGRLARFKGFDRLSAVKVVADLLEVPIWTSEEGVEILPPEEPPEEPPKSAYAALSRKLQSEGILTKPLRRDECQLLSSHGIPLDVVERELRGGRTVEQIVDEFGS